MSLENSKKFMVISSLSGELKVPQGFVSQKWKGTMFKLSWEGLRFAYINKGKKVYVYSKISTMVHNATELTKGKRDDGTGLQWVTSRLVQCKLTYF